MSENVTFKTTLYVDPNNPDHLSSTPFRTPSESTPSPVCDEVEEARAWMSPEMDALYRQWCKNMGWGGKPSKLGWSDNQLKHFAAFVASHIRTQERERAAKKAVARLKQGNWMYADIALAIREN